MMTPEPDFAATSRLSCQILLTEELDGMEVRIPRDSHDMQGALGAWTNSECHLDGSYGVLFAKSCLSGNDPKAVVRF